MSIIEKINKQHLPQHVAIIMDGNGRWAKERGLERAIGHQHGVISVQKVTEAATKIGIKYLTLYTFSTENWNRPQNEVDELMHLLVSSIEKETPTLHKNNIRLQTIGDTSRMPKEVKQRLDNCIDYTSKNTGLTLILALSYSSQWEITEMVKSIAEQVKNNTLNIEDITKETISKNLTTKNLPDPDLLIRTSGEVRISNFLLWQLAYTELYFTEIRWPDFHEEEFYKAIYDFQQRERRFGEVK